MDEKCTLCDRRIKENAIKTSNARKRRQSFRYWRFEIKAIELRRCLWVISIAFVLYSCSQNSSKNRAEDSSFGDVTQNPRKEWYDLKIEEKIEKAVKGKLLFSEIYKDIEYVPLETTSKSLIGAGRHGIQVYTVTPKIIVVDQKIFDRKTGRYLCDLLSSGQGPKEYLSAYVVAGDDEREELYLYDGILGKLYIAGYDGKYKDVLTINDKQYNMFKKIFILGDSNLLITRGGGDVLNFRETHQVLNLSSKSIINNHLSSGMKGYNTEEELYKHKYVFKWGGGAPLIVGDDCYWSYDGKIRFHDFLTDSIYGIEKDFSVNPIGVVGFANLRTTSEKFPDNYIMKWRIYGFFETSDYLFVSLSRSKDKPIYTSQGYLLAYSKIDGSTRVISQGVDQFYATNYQNDIDKGVSTGPLSAIWNERALCGFITPEAIKNRVDEEGAEAFTSEAERKFKAMADTLKEDDNHVVAIYHLK
ncbi:MAG: 6-bladed beta-propeller [Tannerellaceae bacterium]